MEKKDIVTLSTVARDIEDIKSKISSMKERLNKLECPHELTSFTPRAIGYHSYYYERCESCGKGLQLLTEEEYLKTKIKNLKKETKDAQTMLGKLGRKKI